MSYKVSLCFSLVLAGLAVIMATSQSEAYVIYQEDTLAYWEFDSGGFYADTSGNGYTLTAVNDPVQSTDVPTGIGSTGSAYFDRGANTTSTIDLLKTTSNLSLSPYDVIRVTWWQKVSLDNSCVVFETIKATGTGVGNPGTFGCVANSSTSGGVGTQYFVTRSLNADEPDGHASFMDGISYTKDAWEKHVVEYYLEGQTNSSKIVVYDGDGNVVGTDIQTSLGLQGPFTDAPFHMGGRGDHGVYSGDVPYAGFTGWLDDVKIEGLIVGYIPGDANDNGVVDEEDAMVLADNWLTGPDATWAMGDFDGDGYVNDVDATMLAVNWGFGTATEAVPEPSTATMLLLAGLALLVVKTRK